MNEELHETVEQLRQQISDTEQLSVSERESLAAAMAEIQESLGRFEIQSSDLAKRFHLETQKFSDANPRLTQVAGQFADMLAQMGI